MVKPTYDDAYDDDNDDGSSDDELIQDFVNENEDIMDDGVARSFDEQGLDLDEFDCALKKMSITPKNGFSYKFGGGFQEPTRMPCRIRPSTSPESL
ncbi:hypothetical protein SCA6_012537 [Theobroma cacao]